MKATLEAINRMQAEGIIGKYAIGGTVGATFYLEPLATLDIDIFVSLKTSTGGPRVTLTPIDDYLTSRGHRAEKEDGIMEGWPVQFLPPSDALDEEALQQAVETEVDGVRTWVITAEHLAAIALRTARAKDYARLLQFVEAGVLDSNKLDAILRKHGLLVKWEQFGVKFLRGPESSGQDNP
jgi:hypothetical protein